MEVAFRFRCHLPLLSKQSYLAPEARDPCRREASGDSLSRKNSGKKDMFAGNGDHEAGSCNNRNVPQLPGLCLCISVFLVVHELLPRTVTTTVERGNRTITRRSAVAISLSRCD